LLHHREREIQPDEFGKMKLKTVLLDLSSLSILASYAESPD
jgi:hypothetical protein